ncbi:MAG TPA: hypothetical protein DCY48_04590 [Candidatus Magasanikbacteria bacterium]|uniref:Uncharacterized protein n=1 Tax=Candidatus Magasanikbacteria bacterium GW2011_GWA2_46_17 TaxID=1619042 RepID=A0A0G1P2F4_9BACT|nr:MAG: hypothetical protein UX39_C0006G0009 [Candidatus Magasanikbacteria bacterium GW2011_GWA2_46_17]OGH77692.1 MAG: hypothetical protein A3I74_02960 [Candidatus Magasanikbacteria bacterium RIFCSPLOWO2_02_FULL_47_16]OGH79549.1 MAG: hypothetical protein A3C10_00445 [Candidatus Magasanikbacteria bacterium RIFCSPHIGHO2_02_FULL_48_18]OGH83414.1 MAG: hypothetical protein A3G08_01110 [Candidatus Magasanikbacteria bacterium RIFCSPLOWO2_12_FULL_47_9b]HAZ29019.1 hypothetical protein [Candidatus Magasa
MAYVVLFTASSVLAYPIVAMAKKTVGDAGGALQTVVGKSGLKATDAAGYAGIVLAVLFYMSGLAFFVLMFYGGYLWLTARGKEDQVEKAKRVITAALIGLTIIFSAYAITYLVSSRLIQGTPVNKP